MQPFWAACSAALAEEERFSVAAVWTSFVSNYACAVVLPPCTTVTLAPSPLKPPRSGVQAGCSGVFSPKLFLLQADQVPVPQLLLTGQVLLTETIPDDGCLSSTRGAPNWIQCLKVVSQVLNGGEQSLPCTILLLTLPGVLLAFLAASVLIIYWVIWKGNIKGVRINFFRLWEPLVLS